MIFLIFIKNIKKMNCLVLLVCVGDNSETRHISSNSVLGYFLDKFFVGKFLVFCNFCVSGFVEMLLNSNDNFLARQFWLAINGTAGVT